jgi:hypothetical protein
MGDGYAAEHFCSDNDSQTNCRRTGIRQPVLERKQEKGEEQPGISFSSDVAGDTGHFVEERLRARRRSPRARSRQRRAVHELLRPVVGILGQPLQEVRRAVHGLLGAARGETCGRTISTTKSAKPASHLDNWLHGLHSGLTPEKARLFAARFIHATRNWDAAITSWRQRLPYSEQSRSGLEDSLSISLTAMFSTFNFQTK